MPTYKLQELAEEAGVAARTVRYYVQRGLLPTPEFRGKDTVYGREHLLRLHAIKRLQQAHLPLDEIHARLANATEDELCRLSHFDLSGQVVIGEPRATGAVENRGHPYRASGREQLEQVQADSAATMPTPPKFAGTARVYAVAPGVELWVRDEAPAASRSLASDILTRYATIHDDKDADR